VRDRKRERQRKGEREREKELEREGPFALPLSYFTSSLYNSRFKFLTYIDILKVDGLVSEVAMLQPLRFLPPPDKMGTIPYRSNAVFLENSV